MFWRIDRQHEQRHDDEEWHGARYNLLQPCRVLAKLCVGVKDVERNLSAYSCADSGDALTCHRDRQTKERYAEGQRGTAGAYMRMSVTTLRLLRCRLTPLSICPSSAWSAHVHLSADGLSTALRRDGARQE